MDLLSPILKPKPSPNESKDFIFWPNRSPPPTFFLIDWLIWVHNDNSIFMIFKKMTYINAVSLGSIVNQSFGFFFLVHLTLFSCDNTRHVGSEVFIYDYWIFPTKMNTVDLWADFLVTKLYSYLLFYGLVSYVLFC